MGDLTGWDDDPLGMPAPPDPVEGWLLEDLQMLIDSTKGLSGTETIEELEAHEMLLNAICEKTAEHFVDGVVPPELEQPLVEFFPREWKRAADRQGVRVRTLCFHCNKLILAPGKWRQVCQTCRGA